MGSDRQDYDLIVFCVEITLALFMTENQTLTSAFQHIRN